MLGPLIRLADTAYRAGLPLMPDAWFDRLHRLAPSALPPLPADLLSLDCHPDPADWLYEHPGPYCVQLKADGVSVNLVYVDGVFASAHLRGGRDCTEAALRAGALIDLPGLPSGRIDVRCEAIGSVVGAPPPPTSKQPTSKQLNAKQPTSNQPTRNAVAASLRRNGPTDPVSVSLLAFDVVGLPGVTTMTSALTWLTCAGFGVLPGQLVREPAEVLSLFSTFCSVHPHLPFACDGLTVKLDCKLEQHRLGNTSRTPRWAISLKS